MSSPSSAIPIWFAAGLRRLFARRASPAPKYPFDVRHNVDTDGLLYVEDLATGHENDSFNEGYYATAPSLFEGALECWRQSLAGHAIGEYSFIDLGCGKGRVLLLASELPFRGVRGIEINARLVRIARRNARRWLRHPRACGRIAIERGDVLDLRLEDEPVVLFLFNSFSAEVVGPLMERLAAAARLRCAPIDLVYVHPEHDALIGSALGAEPLCRAEIAFSPEDAAADAFQVASDFVSIYRIPAGRSAAHPGRVLH